MARPSRKAVTGSKIQVWHGTAHKTVGGLTKDKLTKSTAGKVVSKAKSLAGRRRFRADPALQRSFRAMQQKYAKPRSGRRA